MCLVGGGEGVDCKMHSLTSLTWLISDSSSIPWGGVGVHVPILGKIGLNMNAIEKNHLFHSSNLVMSLSICSGSSISILGGGGDTLPYNLR